MKNKSLIYLALGIGAGYIAYYFLCKKKKTLFGAEKKLSESDNSIPKSNQTEVSNNKPVKTEKVIAVVDKTSNKIITIPQDSSQTKPLKQNEGLALINVPVVPVLGQSIGTATAIGSTVNNSAIGTGSVNVLASDSSLGKLSASPIVATVSGSTIPSSFGIASASPLTATVSGNTIQNTTATLPFTKNIPLEKISSSSVKSQFDGGMDVFEVGNCLTDI